MPAGEPFTTKNFLGLGPRANLVHNMIQQMARKDSL